MKREVTSTTSSVGDTVLPYVNVVVNENFSLTFNTSVFKIEQLVKNTSSAGCFTTYFNQMRQFRKIRLTEEAKRLVDLPNAGGTSVESETLSFEMLKKGFNASLLKTEMEVQYFPEGGSITDYVCKLFDSVVGVSVTRAMKYNGEFTIDDATTLLNKKLKGIVQSSRNSLVKWDKQILHVWLLSEQVAETTIKAWNSLDSNLKGNTVLLLTVAEKSMELFVNKEKKTKANKKFKMG